MEPILKWAGGKRQLIKEIKAFIDLKQICDSQATYYEPFFGGGAVCFNLELPKCVINDYNEELVNVYKQIRDNHTELIELLEMHEKNHSKEYYYATRNADRDSKYDSLQAIEKAARIIYLNRTCYNGLYRVNKKGEFNVPIGCQNNVDIVMRARIETMHKYLTSSDIKIFSGDFEDAVIDAKAGDFVYFDPPYDYENEKGFSAYIVDGFDRTNLKRLKECADRLVDKQCEVLISNNDTSFVRELFSEQKYYIRELNANRSINRNANGRSGAKEVLIYGKTR